MPYSKVKSFQKPTFKNFPKTYLGIVQIKMHEPILKSKYKR